MPNMANITVKNVANADVVYVAKVASAGDKSPAKWTQDTAQAIPGFRPVLTLVTRDNGPKTARVAEGSYRYPVIQTISGVPTQTDVIPFSFAGTLPQGIDVAFVNEAIVQFGNLLVSALMRASLNEGYAPT